MIEYLCVCADGRNIIITAESPIEALNECIRKFRPKEILKVVEVVMSYVNNETGVRMVRGYEWTLKN